MTDQQHCTPAALALFTLAEIKAAKGGVQVACSHR